MARFEHGGDTYGCPPDLLDCSINLNPMGAPGPVLEGACRAVLDCARYPDPACRGLRRAIARRDGVEEDQILCGNGASDLIYRMALACKLRQALLLAPTFSEYRRALEGVGCQIREHRLEERTGFLPGEDLLEAIVPGVDLVFLCDPNNPTGRLMDGGLLGRVLSRCREVGAFLAVDQCFLELSPGEPDRLVRGRAAASPGADQELCPGGPAPGLCPVRRGGAAGPDGGGGAALGGVCPGTSGR